MQVSDMASEVVWMLTALVILATVCIAVFKRFLGDSVPFSKGPRDFVLDRLARCGDPFTISLMGRTQTVVSSPETIKFVLSTAHASFPVAYPVQFTRLLAMKEIAGERNPYYRRIVLSIASGEGLQKVVPFISSLAERTVKNWESQAVVNSVEELQKFAFSVAVHISWREVEPGSEEMDQIWNKVSCISGGLAALPISLPGFAYHKALKAKQVLESRIQREISSRREAGIQHDDILNALMSIREIEIPDYDICSITVGTMIGAFGGTSALIPFVLNYLENFPKVCQRVQVIYEIIRIEFFSAFPRQANKDVDYNGITFRKGSYVWASGLSLHFNPKYHPNPREFDPSRFDEKTKPNTFMPFGQGEHLCPGYDLGLTETMFIIHHLITKYNWKKCGLDGMAQFPIKSLANYPIRLVKRCMT